MLTNDNKITKPDYWNKIYTGNNDNAKVDASNTKRPASTFDRFAWAAEFVEGPKVLGIGSGHAHVEKRIKAAHKDWDVIASDQAANAQDVAHYQPYFIFSGYTIPFPNKYFDTLVITQAMEYIEWQDMFLTETKRVAKYFVCTVPEGEMAKWSQLRIYSVQGLIDLLCNYGTILKMEVKEGLLLAKIEFND